MLESSKLENRRAKAVCPLCICCLGHLEGQNCAEEAKDHVTSE